MQENDKALSLAATAGHIDIVKLLMERQCDVNVKDSEGSNAALSCALRSGNIRMLLDCKRLGSFL